MKLTKQSAEIWEPELPWEIHRADNGVITKHLACAALDEVPSQEALMRVVYKQIERAGRICYKSEDKITDDSAKPFVDRLIQSEHYAMLEHGTVYLYIKCSGYDSSMQTLTKKYEDNKYSKVTYIGLDDECSNDYKDIYGNEGYGEMQFAITTNLRVIIENGWEDDLQYICSPTEHHAKRVTVHCITNRQVTHELVRHRTMSFAMESTRYCNYNKGKFGSELTFIEPNWFTEEGKTAKICSPEIGIIEYFNDVEELYVYLINKDWKPQQAATILPNALKADIVITGFVDDWEHLFDLRVKGTTGAPHPQMVELMTPVYEEFKKRGYVTD